jgi:excisionase family DNA binding protein
MYDAETLDVNPRGSYIQTVVAYPVTHKWVGAIMDETTPLTLTVPEAGKRYFGLSRNGAYDAAARGEIPTIRIGRLLRVPVRALERMLERASEPAA